VQLLAVKAMLTRILHSVLSTRRSLFLSGGWPERGGGNRQSENHGNAGYRRGVAKHAPRLFPGGNGSAGRTGGSSRYGGAAFARAVGACNPYPRGCPSIHRLRVAFKKFRYTVEVVQPLLDQMGKTELKALNAYQTAMGEIQDAEVLLASIRSFAARRGRPTAISFLPVHQALTSLRMARVEAFMKSAHHLMSFWP